MSLWVAMGLPPRGVPFLGNVALLLAVGCSGASSSPHSLRYFHTAVSEPGPGLPQFIVVGYLDDQPLDRYDSITRRVLPQVPWMEKVVEYEAGYWERQSQQLQDVEFVFRVNLGTLRERFNQQNSTGFHALQVMYGCDVGPDGQFSGGYEQFAYDGEDFLALDRETLTWTARVPQAQETKRRWDPNIPRNQRVKEYVEEECVEWLRRFLGYGNETLLRTEAPVTRVARKKGYDGQETLFCQLYGFYPKDIEVTWMKDGEDRKPETLTGGCRPQLGRDLPHLAQHRGGPQGEGPLPVPGGTRQPAGAPGLGLGGAGIQIAAHCGSPRRGPLCPSAGGRGHLLQEATSSARG